jgi:hypothetical protein
MNITYHFIKNERYNTARIRLPLKHPARVRKIPFHAGVYAYHFHGHSDKFEEDIFSHLLDRPYYEF